MLVHLNNTAHGESWPGSNGLGFAGRCRRSNPGILSGILCRSPRPKSAQSLSPMPRLRRAVLTTDPSRPRNLAAASTKKGTEITGPNYDRGDHPWRAREGARSFLGQMAMMKSRMRRVIHSGLESVNYSFRRLQRCGWRCSGGECTVRICVLERQRFIVLWISWEYGLLDKRLVPEVGVRLSAVGTSGAMVMAQVSEHPKADRALSFTGRVLKHILLLPPKLAPLLVFCSRATG